MATDVQDIDLGWKRIKKELLLIDNSYTTVGIQSDAGKEDDGQNIALVGAYNEFGAPKAKIPARSFMRSTFNEQKAKTNSIINSQHSKILEGVTTVKRALGLIGEFFTGEIKKKITTLKTPANAESTKKRKKSSNPLIDTGRLRASITHKEVLRGIKSVKSK